MRPDVSLDDCEAGVLAGDRALIGRAITLVESSQAAHQRLAEELLRLAETGGHPGRRLGAHQALGLSLFHLGELTAARDHLERGIALASLGLESRLARDDRKAGIVLTTLPCPALVVASTGDASFPPPAYADLSVPAERLVVEGASHWGLVLNRRLVATLVPRVTAWLERVPSGR